MSAAWRKPAGLRGRRAKLLADRCAPITVALRIPSRCNHAQQLGPHAYALRLTSAAWRKPAGLRGRRDKLIADRYANRNGAPHSVVVQHRLAIRPARLRVAAYVSTARLRVAADDAPQATPSPRLESQRFDRLDS